MTRERGRRILTAGTVLILVLSSCGSTAATDKEQTTESTSAVDSTGETVTSAAADDTELDAGNNLPSTSDPCVQPTDFSPIISDLLGEGFVTDFAARDETRPLRIMFSSADAATSEDAVMVIMLHGAGGSNDSMSQTLWRNSFMPQLAEMKPLVTIMAQAEDGPIGFWTQDATFNTDYMAALRAKLENTFCLNEVKVVLVGQGQGMFAVLQGHCSGVFGADVIMLFQGMLKLLDCPAEPAALITFDVYEFDPIIGASWDGAWNPPLAEETAASGGIQSTPEDFDFWLKQYGCSVEPTETFLPVEAARESGDNPRPVTVLAARDCIKPIVAVGGPSASEWRAHGTPFKVEAPVFETINPVMLDELLAAMG